MRLIFNEDEDVLEIINTSICYAILTFVLLSLIKDRLGYVLCLVFCLFLYRQVLCFFLGGVSFFFGCTFAKFWPFAAKTPSYFVCLLV